MSSEEFFMYLTIGLIIVLPVSVRIYRYCTAKQVEKLLQDQFGQASIDASTAAKVEPKR
jgi:hypothetical protein